MTTSPRRSLPNSGRARRGVAPLELVLCLPILGVLLATIFSIASVGLTKADVAVRVRQQAWQQRHGRRSAVELPNTDARLVGLILGPSGRPATGLVRTQQTGRVTVFYPGSPARLATDTQRHAVLAGTWDHMDLPFRHHAPLSPGSSPQLGAFLGAAGAAVNAAMAGFRLLPTFPAFAFGS